MQVSWPFDGWCTEFDDIATGTQNGIEIKLFSLSRKEQYFCLQALKLVNTYTARPVCWREWIS